MIRKHLRIFLFFSLIFFIQISYGQTALPVSAIAETEKLGENSKFEYIISGLSTATDSTDLVTLFKSKPGIIDAFADLSLHKITIYTRIGLPENDIKEVLLFSGKTIIHDPKLLTKYYSH
jgi:hypothetical protein